MNTPRCAVYTRKSSEEGLEQSFNSLHAQREACEAYILSQRHEGWQLIPTDYDDGGFSGGSMERPALKKLLADIAAKRIDTVVVYKVDRLTRSLTDFARIVEQFDKQGISFVSVTQQFNTTTSMGRLTLNVLLSFAQFEREVTGERIRDKIAASKRKGMWMGGVVPIGYDLHDRTLVINDADAERVREIYRLYLELGCVSRLQEHLASSGVLSKQRVSRTGRSSGGAVYSRGALYDMLHNRIYRGEIVHKEKSYPGLQPAIVDQLLWDEVQAHFETNLQAPRKRARTTSPSLLTGLLFDEDGNRFTPSHSAKKGRRYRYYVSQAVIRKRIGPSRDSERLPAQEMEDLVVSRLHALLGSPHRLLDLLAGQIVDPKVTERIVEAARDRDRDDVALYRTIESLKNRLGQSFRVYHPLNGVELTGKSEHFNEVKRLKKELDKHFPRLAVLNTSSCTNEQARTVWDWIFNHEFWHPIARKYEDSLRQYTESAVGSGSASPYTVAIACKLTRAKGMLAYASYKNDGKPLPKGVGLRFSLERTNCPEPYDTHWFVENEGDEASDANQISWDKYEPRCETSTKFHGRQKMTCRLEKSGRTVAEGVFYVNIL